MNDDHDATVESTLRTTQMIGIALALGVTVLLAIAVVLRKDKPADGNQLLSYLGVLFAVAALAVAAAFPMIVTKAAWQAMAESPTIDRLANVFQTSAIIRGALIEGAALANGIFFLVVGDWLNLFVAAILVGVLIYFIPTRSRFLDWLQRQRESHL